MEATSWTPTFAWVATAAGALALALVAPEESVVMGRLPAPITAKRLDQQQVSLPQGLPAERTLAIVAFRRQQRAEVQSWIDGLKLKEGSPITWVRMPVLEDPGNEPERKRIEARLLERHTQPADRSRLVPLFTDREAFIRAARLSGTEHASVLVLDRQGRVLARVEGEFDEAKAQALKETLLAQND